MFPDTTTAFTRPGVSQVWATADDVTRRNLYAVAMVQPEAYWAVGEAGTLVHSDDGGATWAVRPPPLDLTAALYGVSFADDGSGGGWAVGSGGSVLRAERGATVGAPTTWAVQVSGTLRTLWGVYALSGAEAWVVGERGTVLRTVTGGVTWQPQTTLGTSFQQAMYAVQFVGELPTCLVLLGQARAQGWERRPSFQTDDVKGVFTRSHRRLYRKLSHTDSPQIPVSCLSSRKPNV